MINTVRQFFFGKDPQLGEVWAFDCKNPFVKPSSVTILGIKNGYVQYRATDGQTCSMLKSEFKSLYKRYIDEKV